MKKSQSSSLKTLFVSRELDSDSAIIPFCAEQNMQLIHQSLLLFSEVPFELLPDGDWLFFYSKSGVRFFLNQLNDVDDLQAYKIACYGPSTARVWKLETSKSADFIGNGKPEDVPRDFMNVILENETVVFIRAMHSKMAVQKKIDHQVKCKDVIAYKNSRRTDIQISQDVDYAMLTSPMNADAFLEELPDYAGLIITLGSTTSEHLLKHYRRDSVAAEDITEEGMLVKLKEIIESKP